MRMIMLVQFPVEPFNSFVRSGSIGETMHRILDSIKPEATYFTERDGHRGAILVVDLKDASDVATMAEPWFLAFNAQVEYRIAMTPEDLGRANLAEIGSTWA
jgi:hypothetical protein